MEGDDRVIELNEQSSEATSLFEKDKHFRFRIVDDKENDDIIYQLPVLKSEYDHFSSTMAFNPLQPFVPIYILLAYHYGCLNQNKNDIKRMIYRFEWKLKNDEEWKTWFKVHPYLDVQHERKIKQ
jgi:hypothetical protein